MRLRSTLILALIFAALAGYLYFVEREKVADEAKKKKLFEIDTEAVTGVALTYPDRKIVVKKVDGKWRLTEPLDDLADESAVTNLVRAIADCEVKKSLDDVPQNLAPFGLDKPHVEVLVTLKDRELPVIKVGKTSPVGFSTYLQRADEPKVYLTTSAFHSGTDRQVKDLRDKQILAFSDDQIRKIALRAEDRELVLAKKEDAWTVEQPAAHPADAGIVRSFLSTLRTMRATDFPAEDASDLTTYGLDKPRLAITLTGEKEDDQKRVLVGGENDKKDIYVKVAARPTIYTVGSFVHRDLNKTVNDFRDKTVVSFQPDAVTTVALKHGDGEQLIFTRTNKDAPWVLSGNATPPEAAKVTQLLTDLKDLKGHEIAADQPGDLAPYGLAAPALTIELAGKDGALATAKLGRHKGEADADEFTAIREGQPTVFKLREFLFTRLDKHAADFLPKPTPNAPAVAVPPEPEEPEEMGQE